MNAIDLLAQVSPIFSQWVPYTPTVTPSTGAITTLGAVSGRYKILGKTVLWEADVAITTNGTGAGALQVTLPSGFAPAANFILAGREINVTGSMLQARAATGSNAVAVLTYNNGYPGGDGTRIVTSGVIEIA